MKCNITVSSPNPITRYEYLQDSIRVDGNTDRLLFSAVKRNDTGSWTCKGVIDQSGANTEKESTPKPVEVFCK